MTDAILRRSGLKVYEDGLGAESNVRTGARRYGTNVFLLLGFACMPSFLVRPPSGNDSSGPSCDVGTAKGLQVVNSAEKY